MGEALIARRGGGGVITGTFTKVTSGNSVTIPEIIGKSNVAYGRISTNVEMGKTGEFILYGIISGDTKTCLYYDGSGWSTRVNGALDPATGKITNDYLPTLFDYSAIYFYVAW